MYEAVSFIIWRSSSRSLLMDVDNAKSSNGFDSSLRKLVFPIAVPPKKLIHRAQIVSRPSSLRLTCHIQCMVSVKKTSNDWLICQNEWSFLSVSLAMPTESGLYLSFSTMATTRLPFAFTAMSVRMHRMSSIFAGLLSPMSMAVARIAFWSSLMSDGVGIPLVMRSIVRHAGPIRHLRCSGLSSLAKVLR